MALTFFKIQTVTVGSGGAATIDFTSIPQSYTDLKIICSLRNSSGSTTYTDVAATFNGVTSGYSSKILYSNNGTSSAAAQGTSQTRAIWFAQASGSSTTSGNFGNSEIYIPNYNSNTTKTWGSISLNDINATTAAMWLGAGEWSGAGAISSISLFNDNPGGNFAQYSSATLYGIKKA
jgi:hypothetical protein